MKELTYRETGINAAVRGVLYCLAAVFCFAAVAKAQDPFEVLDTWNDGSTGAWFSVESKAVLSNPSDYLNVQFPEQRVSKSESDVVRRNIGLGAIVTNISFRFKAVDVLPSEVRLYFHSVRSGYSWFVGISPVNVGAWGDFNVPVNRGMAWVVGPDGCVQQFEGDVGFVDWVGVYVRRHGSGGAQNYSLDDFRVAGYKMEDVDGDGIPDFWEMVNNVNTNDPRHASYDIDGDGLNMYEEYKAGTDPTDPTSSLAMSLDQTNDVISANGIVVKWTSIGGHFYTLYKSTNLMEGFSVITSNILATPPANSYQDGAATNDGPYFYRVKVE